ncbi:CUB domain-containing protein, partial [Cysteiniphilum litorale]|uniref:CUB domain-containing protein n=1 Tax=Cysteiniphilum litorale TaxID=2056700 RepID=UPI003F882194
SRGDSSRDHDRLIFATDCTVSPTTATYVPVDSVLSFTSPAYPIRYTKNTSCGFDLTTDPQYVFEMFCPFVSIQHDDYLLLWDDDWNTFAFLEQVYSKSLHFFFWGNDIRVGFETGSKGESYGFQCYAWPILLSNLQPPSASTL